MSDEFDEQAKREAELRGHLKQQIGIESELCKQAELYIAERDDLRREVKNYASVIDETLRLADFLNDIAARGAGFGEHWGERVMQSVETLRNVKSFPSKTLEHNRMLLEHNGKLVSERDNLRREVERLKEEVDVGLSISGSFFEALKPLNLAMINVADPGSHVTELITEIAALKAAIDSRDRRCDVALRVIRDRDAEIAALKAKLAEITDSNKFLVEAIDAAIKDRDYFEGKLSENDLHGLEMALAALDPTIPGHAQAAKYIRAAIHRAEVEKKP